MKCSVDLSTTLTTFMAMLHVCPIPGCRAPGPVLGVPTQQGKAISEPCASCLWGRDCVHPISASPDDSARLCHSSPAPNTILVTEGRRWAGSKAQEPSQGPELRQPVTVVFIKGFLSQK